MKKLISTVWPFIHAWLGFITIGALGRAVFSLRVPFTEGMLWGPTVYRNPLPTEYAFFGMLAGLPGVFYAAGVAAASESKRKALAIILTVFALVAGAICVLGMESKITGARTYPSLGPLHALVALAALLALSLGMAFLAQTFNRKKRLIVIGSLLAVSFGVSAVMPDVMIEWYKASLRRIRPGLLSLDPESTEHFLLRLRHTEDKHALLQLGYLQILDYVPSEELTRSEGSNLWHEVRSNIGDVAYIDATWSTVGWDLPHRARTLGEDAPLLRVWDRPQRAEFWDEVTKKHGMRRLARQGNRSLRHEVA